MRRVECRIRKALHTDKRVHAVILVNLEQVLDGASLRVLRTLGNLIYLQPVATSLLGEEEHVVVVGGGVDVFDEVLVACRASLRTHTSAVLCAELAQRRTLDVAQVRDGDDHLVVGVEVFRVEIAREGVDFRAALVTIFVADFHKLLLDYLAEHMLVVENVVVMGYELHQFVVLVAEFLHFESGELAESHLNYCAGLYLVELEALRKSQACLLRGLAATDYGYHLVDVVGGDHQTFQYVGAFLSLAQVVACAAEHHVAAVVHKRRENLFKIQRLGTSVHKCHVVHAERSLQLCQFEELVENHLGICIFLDVDHDVDLAACRGVGYVGDALDFLLFGKLVD